MDAVKRQPPLKKGAHGDFVGRIEHCGRALGGAQSLPGQVQAWKAALVGFLESQCGQLREIELLRAARDAGITSVAVRLDGVGTVAA